MDNLKWGIANDGIKFKVIMLWWNSVKISSGNEINDILTDIKGRGVYTFEAFHNAYNGKNILYLGQSGASKEDDGKAETNISDRISRSIKKFGYYGDINKNKFYLYSDCWDLELRWAYIEQFQLIRVVEEYLIRTHSPGFNKQLVRGQCDSDEKIIILNGGEKGHILPVICSIYNQDKLWPWPPMEIRQIT